MTPLRRTRVLIVNDSLNVGGAERVAVDIANSLDRSRHEVLFCSTRVSGPLRSQINEDIPVNILGRSATWDIAKLFTFAKYINKEQVDVIHSHGRGTMKFVALARELRLIKARHVFHDHFGWLHVDRGAGRGLRLALNSAVDAYIGVDQRLCDWAKDTARIDPSRVNLIRSGVDLDRFTNVVAHDLRSELDLPTDALVLMMVANFRPQKDHPTLLRAMADLTADQRERLRLIVVGSTTADVGYHAKCVEMAEHLGIDHLVRFIGARDDTPELLAGADAAVLSSKNETGPLVVLEYMASAKPFIATDTGQITDAVRDLRVGLIPAPRDHHEVADALGELLEMSRDERSEMGRRGRRAAEELFSQSAAIEQVERVYQKVLGL